MNKIVLLFSFIAILLMTIHRSLQADKFIYACPDDLVVYNPVVKLRGIAFRYTNHTTDKITSLAKFALKLADRSVNSVLGKTDPKNTNVFVFGAAYQVSQPSVYSIKLIYGPQIRNGLAQCCVIVSTETGKNTMEKVVCGKPTYPNLDWIGQSTATSPADRL